MKFSHDFIQAVNEITEQTSHHYFVKGGKTGTIYKQPFTASQHSVFGDPRGYSQRSIDKVKDDLIGKWNHDVVSKGIHPDTGKPNYTYSLNRDDLEDK